MIYIITVNLIKLVVTVTLLQSIIGFLLIELFVPSSSKSRHISDVLYLIMMMIRKR